VGFLHATEDHQQFFSPSSSLVLDKRFWMIDLRRLEEKFLWTDFFFFFFAFSASFARTVLSQVFCERRKGSAK